MSHTLPTSLASIDEVEVVDLRELQIGPGTFMTKGARGPSVNVRGDEAQRIGELWRYLPPGMQARCHIPPFGLRFYSEGVMLAAASICWQCNNIHGELMGEKFFYEFDSSHETAQELLTRLEQIVGHPAAE